MNQREKLLVLALANADAVRIPIRSWSGHLAGNRTIAAPLLGTLGVPVRVGGSDATRKSGERQLQELEADGLLIVRRHGRVKFPYCKLTERGDEYTRRLCGLPGWDCGVAFLAELARIEPTYADRWTGEPWIPETELTSERGKGWGDGEGRELWVVETCALPAIARGWAEAHSGSHGHSAYRLTDAGRAELANPSPAPDLGEMPDEAPDGMTVYNAAVKAELEEMRKRIPDDPHEVGRHPLTHCLLALASERKAVAA